MSEDTFMSDDQLGTRLPSSSTPDAMTVAAAGFLLQVLDLEDDARDLARDLSVIKRDANAAIYTVQLDSSVGLAAFLVYAYVLESTGGDGHTGRELYDAGLDTLQRASQRNTPGPRAVAHATTETHGFILATTPGTYRALTGNQSDADLEPSPADLPPTSNIDRVRSDSAERLLALLKDANQEARTWIGAMQTASQRAGDAEGETISFTEEETELALFLLDNESIGDLLRSLNMLVATAQEHTAQAIGMDDPEDDGLDPATRTWPRS